ncbi:cation:proton antiporter domain-containing protein [Sabulicella glaciei]|uniref:Cation:proton antiporter n=1 Tax=Sabulicella glaciei TaxID=2984948 RepID=A0ABT3P0F8_9PROT|nr:cation:proton antiporter [Roseococcus sp. MDT2-1-1]MCW8087900.1 cation:proton antiporter [Roseococcus sp. MDT2-1-1]
MAILQAVLELMAACILLALVARALRLPYAVVLILAGMALAFAPGVPRLALDPELALAFVLPPLLMGSAYRTDWQAFRRNLRPILLLAVGCAVFTAFALDAARAVLHQRHAEGHLPEEFLVKLNEELDLEEGRVERALG